MASPYSNTSKFYISYSRIENSEVGHKGVLRTLLASFTIYAVIVSCICVLGPLSQKTSHLHFYQSPIIKNEWRSEIFGASEWDGHLVSKIQFYTPTENLVLKFYSSVTLFGTRGDLSYSLYSSQYEFNVSVSSPIYFLYYIPLVDYDAYYAQLSVNNATNSSIDISRSWLVIDTVDRNYVIFEICIKYIFLFVTLVIAFAPRIGFFLSVNRIQKNLRSFEQFWTRVLLIALIFFDDPFVASQVCRIM